MLETTLTVAPTPDGFDLSLAIENSGSDTVTLSFRDGQRAEFVAERADDDGGGSGAVSEEVWRWSDGRTFAMALGSEELAPGESATYTATWSDPEPGEYTVRAWLTATGVEAGAETVLVVD